MFCVQCCETNSWTKKSRKVTFKMKTFRKVYFTYEAHNSNVWFLKSIAWNAFVLRRLTYWSLRTMPLKWKLICLQLKLQGIRSCKIECILEPKLFTSRTRTASSYKFGKISQKVSIALLSINNYNFQFAILAYSILLPWRIFTGNLLQLQLLFLKCVPFDIYFLWNCVMWCECYNFNFHFVTIDFFIKFYIEIMLYKHKHWYICIRISKTHY